MTKQILIVEDERLVALDIKSIIEELELGKVSIADSYDSAMQSIREEKPDLVILDVRLNENSRGTDVAKELNIEKSIPYLFLTSHYDKDTVDEIVKLNPVSYLTKPYKDHELAIAVQMALENGKTNGEVRSIVEDKSPKTIFVKDKHSLRKINVDELIFIKGEGSYTKLQLTDERVVLRIPLKSFQQIRLNKGFTQTHRSYFVNLNKIDQIYSKHLLAEGHEIPISKGYKDDLISKVNTIS